MFAPALLHQLNAFQWSLVWGHSGATHRRRLLHFTYDFWTEDGGDNPNKYSDLLWKNVSVLILYIRHWGAFYLQLTCPRMYVFESYASLVSDTHLQVADPACSMAALSPPPLEV